MSLSEANTRGGVAAGAARRSPIDWSGAILNGYLVLFFAYMFLPLLFMVVAAFNANPTPSVTDWQGFSFRWFAELPQDERFLQGLVHSLAIAIGVIVIAIPLGLAGALVLTRLQSRGTTVLYTVLVSPILTPGIVLGATTMIFWRDAFGVQAGLLTATIAQAGFIASYCMLMFMARLQRQDRVLEEAALDLGASSVFVFRRITLPFLMPTILTASVISFLQSIENYNTTFFAIGSSWTLVTEIGARMRFGLSPVVNVIGVIFVAITIVAATAWVLSRRRAGPAAG
ncbi:ABC transporter permease [Stappia taiwanensis]|uniref:ABC transporter permease n=1 Tax=Stappia taiwanensis TaxID=992267 RepID=A0A838XZN4_9HYPH|nr:ABC transporter permease [Stappia taiwanensis]MBA4612200.1 ABC transporter permease [Stappia taiwanensis]GGE92824.1 spermidine/putrescine ABC transporter permease [Stappia taiwanensis]